MKKTLIVFVSIILPFTLITCNQVQASEVPHVANIDLEQDRYTVRQQNNIVKVTNELEEVETTVIFKNNYQSAVIEERNEKQQLLKNSTSNLITGKNLFLETKQSKSNLRKITSNSNRFKYVTTFRTKKSAYRKSGSLGVAAASFLGGPAGTIATIAGVIASLGSFAKSNEVYIKIIQYYNPYTHIVRNKYYFYKKSNYTGFLKSSTSEQRLFG